MDPNYPKIGDLATDHFNILNHKQATQKHNQRSKVGSRSQRERKGNVLWLIANVYRSIQKQDSFPSIKSRLMLKYEEKIPRKIA